MDKIIFLSEVSDKKEKRKIMKFVGNNVNKIRNCYGCGMCATVCAKNIIQIELNSSGFYEPRIIDLEKCTSCGLCLDVCAFSHEELANKGTSPVESWAAWSNDEDVRRKCSSGGIGFEIGKQLVEKGYQAIGCRYDIKKQRAEHYIALTVEDFVASIGSKYIQSYTVDAFKQIKRREQKYLVTGTPCQIDSFRHMIKKFRCEDNFVLLDFFCHCVPSMHVWRAYIKMLEPRIGKITYASWRNKFEYGWHDSWLMGMDGEKTSQPVNWQNDYRTLLKERRTAVQSRLSQGDLFYKLFLGDVCLGPQCAKQCKYKYDQSSADLRIGDLWGTTYKEDQKGVSALIAFTEKGKEVVGMLDHVTLVPHPFEIVAEGQMRYNASLPAFPTLLPWVLKHGIRIDTKLFKVIKYGQNIGTRAWRKISRRS